MRAEVREWFQRRTYQGSDFTAAELVQAKGTRTVSVVLPARDEESTVGVIVEAIRRALKDEVPLVDEIVVIDSDSTDRTAQVAAAAGAVVHQQSSVLPRLGNVPGKGEALWKSLYVTTGDVIVFVDADLRDFDPHFVVGLLGPVLRDGVSYVKGCYDRPLDTGQTVIPAGGGRVTELVARPLLNAHWPLLAGFVQPLAGEYAGTRECLEAVPFVSGYGVEIGLLIDLVESRDLSQLAQVDLGVRKHRNSPDEQLSRMASQIMLTVHDRLERHGHMVASSQPSETITQFTRADEEFGSTVTDLEFSERPPMVSVREYAQRSEPQAV